MPLESQPEIRPETHRDFRLFLLALAAVVIVLDRLSKLWITAHLPQGHYLTVIPGIFRISHVFNFGAAFSLFGNVSPTLLRNALIAFSIIAVLAVLAMIHRIGRAPSLTGLALGLILGGAIGNLYDRLRFGYVVDFLEVRIVHYHWPDFNVADSCIVIGACLLLLEIFHTPPPEPHDSQSLPIYPTIDSGHD